MYCEALLTTESEADKEVSDLFSPVSEEVSNFFNEGKKEDVMWVHGESAMRISNIDELYRVREGYTRVQNVNGSGFCFRCSVDDIRKAIGETV